MRTVGLRFTWPSIFQSTRLFSAEGLLGMSRLMPSSGCSRMGPTYPRRLRGVKRRLTLLGRIVRGALKECSWVSSLEVLNFRQRPDMPSKCAVGRKPPVTTPAWPAALGWLPSSRFGGQMTAATYSGHWACCVSSDCSTVQSGHPAKLPQRRLDSVVLRRT